MTTVRLAMTDAGHTTRATFSNPALRPAILVSYIILEEFLRDRPGIFFGDWVLDSGAYSAHTKGTAISLDAFIADALRLQAEPGSTLSEVFALDVIGDWRASMKNTEEMWRRGVPAVPCYHEGEPWSVLTGLAADYPKVAIGGMVGVAPNRKRAWVQECFSRVWPKKIHGFGITNVSILETVPFHTVDASNWMFAPLVKGKFSGLQAPGRISPRHLGPRRHYNLQSEVRAYMRLQTKLKFLWRRELAELEAAHV